METPKHAHRVSRCDGAARTPKSLSPKSAQPCVVAPGDIIEAPPKPSKVRPPDTQLSFWQRNWRDRLALGSTCPGLHGALTILPSEVVELIVKKCDSKQLARLETTCRYFICSTMVSLFAKADVSAIPRALDLRPDVSKLETWPQLLHFLQSQSRAAAQNTAVSLGNYHTAVLLNTHAGHTLYTFGRGFHGQIGNGGFDDHNFPTDCLANLDCKEPPAVVSCGGSHNALITTRGKLFTWGLASSGELGHGGRTPSEVTSLLKTRIVSVSAGGNHTLAISETGHVWACGRGRHGQLGLGTFRDEGMLQPVDRLRDRIVAVAAGKQHSMALATDGSLWTWGDGCHGQLGHEVVANVMAVDANPPIAVPLPQKISALEPARLHPSERVTAIAAGAQHSTALTVGGKLLVFGCNSHGALGLGNVVKCTMPTEVQLAAFETPLDKGDEKPRMVRVVQVQCGQLHTLILLHHSGRSLVMASGYNAWGQLGLCDQVERHVFKTVPALKHVPIVSLACGDNHSAAITERGEVYLWGRGDCGQLGSGRGCSSWSPQKLKGFTVVHPDITLRRHNRRS